MDFKTWEPYLIIGFAAAISWLFKSSIQYGKDIVKLQTVFEYYIERQTKDAAIRLEQVNNPTPPDKQKLLQKYREELISKDELAELIIWLKTLDTNPKADSAERSAALQLLTGMETLLHVTRTKKRWWNFV